MHQDQQSAAAADAGDPATNARSGCVSRWPVCADAGPTTACRGNPGGEQSAICEWTDWPKSGLSHVGQTDGDMRVDRESVREVLNC